MKEFPKDNNWEMVVFDIDGTLMDYNGFDPEMIPLIRKLEDLGLIVSLASGRTLPNITPIMQSLALSGFIVAENGGVVWDTVKGHGIKVLADGSRAKEAAKWLSTKIDGFDSNGIESNRWRETEWCVYPEEDYEKMCELLSEIHIISSHVDKSVGLKIALEQRGIDPSKIIACGDGPNDIPMFKIAGWSVAIDNRFEEVVNAADHTTIENGRAGTIEFLRSLIEILQSNGADGRI
jgi:hydroxymethylpyrimidine pyrophosphatase-like HAD family hydrolase